MDRIKLRKLVVARCHAELTVLEATLSLAEENKDEQAVALIKGDIEHTTRQLIAWTDLEV